MFCKKTTHTQIGANTYKNSKGLVTGSSPVAGAIKIRSATVQTLFLWYSSESTCLATSSLNQVLPLEAIFVPITLSVQIVSHIFSPGNIPLRGMRDIAPPFPVGSLLDGANSCYIPSIFYLYFLCFLGAFLFYFFYNLRQ